MGELALCRIVQLLRIAATDQPERPVALGVDGPLVVRVEPDPLGPLVGSNHQGVVWIGGHRDSDVSKCLCVNADLLGFRREDLLQP